MKHVRTFVRHYQWTKSKYKAIIEHGSGGLSERAGVSKKNPKLLPSLGLPQTAAKKKNPLLQLVNSNFPPIQFAFGYGSGVLQQSGYSANEEAPQIDLIFAIEDTANWEWHAQNLLRNNDHYSGIKAFGGVKIILVLQKLGAGVYFNPLVPVEHEGSRLLIKYGVVSRSDVIKDLTEWSSLYIAGRLQKPVSILRNEDDANSSMKLAYEYNLQLAMHLATLLLHSEGRTVFRQSSLFETITSLSYLGDFRMLIGGENPNKVKNIVSKQVDLFLQLYRPCFDGLLEGNVVHRVGDQNRIDLQEQDVYDALESLPLNFRTKFYSFHNQGSVSGLKDPAALRQSLLKTVKSIVRYPSIVQMAKGLLTAGLLKSFRYAWEKKKKNLGRK